MTYETVTQIASMSGLFYFIAIFAGVLIYALRPKARSAFEDAAQIPFKEN